MSWDASLTFQGVNEWHSMGDWNYTHNTSRMIYAALGGRKDSAWYATLDGTSGSGGADYLHQIIVGLEADPEKFRALNPENGWGDYDSLLEVLHEMRSAGREWPEGKWWCSG